MYKKCTANISTSFNKGKILASKIGNVNDPKQNQLLHVVFIVEHFFTSQKSKRL